MQNDTPAVLRTLSASIEGLEQKIVRINDILGINNLRKEGGVPECGG